MAVIIETFGDREVRSATIHGKVCLWIANAVYKEMQALERYCREHPDDEDAEIEWANDYGLYEMVLYDLIDADGYTDRETHMAYLANWFGPMFAAENATNCESIDEPPTDR